MNNRKFLLPNKVNVPGLAPGTFVPSVMELTFKIEQTLAQLEEYTKYNLTCDLVVDNGIALKNIVCTLELGILEPLKYINDPNYTNNILNKVHLILSQELSSALTLYMNYRRIPNFYGTIINIERQNALVTPSMPLETFLAIFRNNSIGEDVYKCFLRVGSAYKQSMSYILDSVLSEFSCEGTDIQNSMNILQAIISVVKMNTDSYNIEEFFNMTIQDVESDIFGELVEHILSSNVWEYLMSNLDSETYELDFGLGYANTIVDQIIKILLEFLKNLCIQYIEIDYSNTIKIMGELIMIVFNRTTNLRIDSIDYRSDLIPSIIERVLISLLTSSLESCINKNMYLIVNDYPERTYPNVLKILIMFKITSNIVKGGK